MEAIEGLSYMYLWIREDPISWLLYLASMLASYLTEMVICHKNLLDYDYDYDYNYRNYDQAEYEATKMVCVCDSDADEW